MNKLIDRLNNIVMSVGLLCGVAAIICWIVIVPLKWVFLLIPMVLIAILANGLIAEIEDRDQWRKEVREQERLQGDE